MQRRITGLTLVLSALMLLTCAPATADQIDQSTLSLGFNFNTQSFGPTAMLGQTFTAGITGQLTSVVFGLLTTHAASTGTGDVVLSIRNVSGGLPGNTILGAVTINGSFNSSNVIALPLGINVVAGTQYAIVLQATANSFPRWRGLFPGTYSGGAGVWFGMTQTSANSWEAIDAFGNPADFSFETRVSPVPEPSTLLLLGSGLLGFAMKRFRRH